MQIDYVKISCKKDVHIYCTNFAKEMERNSHEITSRRKTYGKQSFSEDLEVRDDVLHMFSSKKSKLMWHKIKNKKTLVLHLSNIYKLTYLN
jgi:hypothetical protein